MQYAPTFIFFAILYTNLASVFYSLNQVTKYYILDTVFTILHLSFLFFLDSILYTRYAIRYFMDKSYSASLGKEWFLEYGLIHISRQQFFLFLNQIRNEGLTHISLNLNTIHTFLWVIYAL